jgi:5-methylcytosine-specific restriction enzyme A
VNKGEIPEASEEDEEFAEAEEGRILTRIHRSRERSRKLVENKKASVLKANGHLKCEVCSFDFEMTYGERGKGFIEAHHVKPVHTLAAGEKTKLEDLVLLCSNCHRIVHTQRPWLTVEELGQLIKD